MVVVVVVETEEKNSRRWRWWAGVKGNALMGLGGEWANRQSYMETCWLHTCCFRPATIAPFSLRKSITNSLVTASNQKEIVSSAQSKCLPKSFYITAATEITE